MEDGKERTGMKSERSDRHARNPPATWIAAIAVDVAAASAPAFAQTSEQEKCINLLNKQAGKVAKAQGKENLACVKGAGRGKLIGSAQDCLRADGKNKVGKARDKVETIEAGKCSGTDVSGSGLFASPELSEFLDHCVEGTPAVCDSAPNPGGGILDTGSAVFVPDGTVDPECDDAGNSADAVAAHAGVCNPLPVETVGGAPLPAGGRDVHGAGRLRHPCGRRRLHATGHARCTKSPHRVHDRLGTNRDHGSQCRRRRRGRAKRDRRTA
jgi:hypothetical protein